MASFQLNPALERVLATDQQLSEMAKREEKLKIEKEQSDEEAKRMVRISQPRNLAADLLASLKCSTIWQKLGRFWKRFFVGIATQLVILPTHVYHKTMKINLVCPSDKTP